MNPKITILGAFSVILAVIPITTIHLGTEYVSLVSGFAVLGYLGAEKLLNRKILESSSSKKTKAFQDLIETVSLFLIVGAVGLTQIVPSWLAILAVGLAGITKIYLLQMNKRYRKNYQLVIGQDYWILLTALVFLGSFLNSYFLFYGLTALCLILGYDLVSLVRELER